MGTDFLNRMKRPYARMLDARAVMLRTPTLLDTDMTCVQRSARGKIKDGTTVREGDRVMICEMDGKFVAQRGYATVIELEKPPADYADRVRRGGCIAEGEVTVVNPISQTAEVSFCE